MTKEQLDAVLADHERWLSNDGGKRANLTRANLTGADLTGANLTGANLTGADLTGADLTRANLTRADLTGANLTGAYLTGANLTGTNLYGANLTGANLTGADLTGARIDGRIDGQTIVGLLRRATRSDGYEFFLWHFQEGFFVRAGCRFLSLPKARSHWRKTRGGTPLGDETMDILTFFAAAIRRATP